MTNEITTPAIGSPAPANANANGDAQEQHNHAADYALDNFRRTLGHLDDLSWTGGEIAAEVLSFFEMELNPKTVEEIEQYLAESPDGEDEDEEEDEHSADSRQRRPTMDRVRAEHEDGTLSPGTDRPGRLTAVGGLRNAGRQGQVGGVAAPSPSGVRDVKEEKMMVLLTATTPQKWRHKMSYHDVQATDSDEPSETVCSMMIPRTAICSIRWTRPWLTGLLTEDSPKSHEEIKPPARKTVRVILPS